MLESVHAIAVFTILICTCRPRFLCAVAKDLIRHLLVVDTTRRYKSIDVLCHAWVLTRGNSKRLDRATLAEAQLARRRELEALGLRVNQEYRQVKEREREKDAERNRTRQAELFGGGAGHGHGPGSGPALSGPGPAANSRRESGPGLPA